MWCHLHGLSQDLETGCPNEGFIDFWVLLYGNISQIEYLDLYTISLHVLHLLILRSRGLAFRNRS